MAIVLLAGGCDMPTPMAPAEPIGTFPKWGESFQAPPAQPSTMMPAAGTSSTGAAMPGAIASFSGGDAAAGKAIFEAKCASCHGGGGEGGVAMNAPALNTASWQERTTDAQLARSIALGKGAMPAFRDSLNKQQLADVIAYVRSLKKP